MVSNKIGCVIAYRKGHTNYGTSLVGYALLKKLQQMGYAVEVINYIKRPTIMQKVSWVVNALRCGDAKDVLSRFTKKRGQADNQAYNTGIAERTKAVEAYKEKKLIPLFHDYIGYDALHEGSKNYRAVIVGSDQVWTPMGLPTKFYNLLFVDDSVRKIAYASSFGVSSIPAFQRKATGAYLDRYYKISVRELKGKEIVESLSYQKAQVVADPTMLLDSNEWTEEIKDSKVKTDEPYIFCYFLGTNMEARKAANELKAKTGYKIITLRHMDEYVAEDEQFGDYAPYDVDPNDFLTYIKNAAYVFTDSFHCSAFSIQFHKKFMTFYRFRQGSTGSRNSRIDSLLSLFNLKERLYQGDISKIENDIDYEYVDCKLKELREESIAFLKEALV
jgi:hypothetical protein